ncbi:unnamed protein product [Notodromas monacha]|uniref:STAS domain-containing protein n=1 Tax=Notodromas monacha TaxID=399045 RepID=A0A7R9GEZ9_9CRUS|nr:unnamed protein product [Notodromas monacha]CAG0918802.1 unnamed protein product [Notodromas monacha]
MVFSLFVTSTGSVVMLALAFFTPYMGYIPSPALGAVVICAVLHFIEYEEAIHIWKTKRSDTIPLAITFFSCLVIGLEWGFLVGVLSNLLMLLIVTSNPSVPVLKFRISDEMRVVIFRPDRFLFYPGIQKVRNLINKGAIRNKDAVIVVDCINLVDIDFTGSKGLGSIAAALQKREQRLVFVNITAPVSKALRNFTFGDVVIYETAQLSLCELSLCELSLLAVVAPHAVEDLGALKRSLSHADLRCASANDTSVDGKPSTQTLEEDDDEDEDYSLEEELFAYSFKMELENMGRSFSDVTFAGAEPGSKEHAALAARFQQEIAPGFGTGAYFRKKARDFCSERALKKQFPLWAWGPKYTAEDFVGDLIAGLTVGFTLVPQVIAFSELANLPAEGLEKKNDMRKFQTRDFCSERALKKQFPLWAWGPKYTAEDFVGDLIAGLTVGFTLVPQVIAFSELANLPAEVSQFFIYLFFSLYRLMNYKFVYVMSPLSEN